MTNEEKIKNMTTDELVVFLQSLIMGAAPIDCSKYCKDFDFGCAYTCQHEKGALFVEKWLRDEA
jgi:hypothetical protein